MKSPAVQKMVIEGTIVDPQRYSDLMVLPNGANFYIGTLYHTSSGMDLMGTRESDDFETREEASEFLEAIETGRATTTKAEKL